MGYQDRVDDGSKEWGHVRHIILFHFGRKSRQRGQGKMVMRKDTRSRKGGVMRVKNGDEWIDDVMNDRGVVMGTDEDRLVRSTETEWGKEEKQGLRSCSHEKNIICGMHGMAGLDDGKG